MYIYKRIYEYFFSQLCRQFHIQVQTGYHWLIQACHMDLASVHFHNVSVFCKNERYLCSIYLMWVVLLQCAVLNILCNDSTNHILHLYYCKFPYKAWGEVPLESKRQTIYCHTARNHCLLDSLLLQTNPVLCPSRKMHFDGNIMGLISVHVKQFSIYRN